MQVFVFRWRRGNERHENVRRRRRRREKRGSRSKGHRRCRRRRSIIGRSHLQSSLPARERFVHSKSLSPSSDVQIRKRFEACAWKRAGKKRGTRGLKTKAQKDRGAKIFFFSQSPSPSLTLTSDAAQKEEVLAVREHSRAQRARACARSTAGQRASERASERTSKRERT